MNSYMNSYMNKVCVYNGVYERNIPVSMIHLYTRGLGTHTRGEAHLSLFKSCVNRYLQKGLGLIPTWRPMVLFYKTWLIVLLTDASFEKLFLKVCFERSFLYKEKLYKRGRDLYSLIFERPHVLFS